MNGLNQIFADIINNAVFNGMQVVKPEELFPMMNALTGIDWTSKAIDQMIKEGRKITIVSAYAHIEEKARNEGINRGISIGREQMKSACAKAENKGISDTRKDNAGRMLKAGKLSEEDISSYTGLSVSEVKDLKKSLNC